MGVTSTVPCLGSRRVCLGRGECVQEESSVSSVCLRGYRVYQGDTQCLGGGPDPGVALPVLCSRQHLTCPVLSSRQSHPTWALLSAASYLPARQGSGCWGHLDGAVARVFHFSHGRPVALRAARGVVPPHARLVALVAQPLSLGHLRERGQLIMSEVPL